MATPVVVVLPLAAAGGAASTYLVRAVAVRLGVVDRPNPIVPQHTRPVAYLGGVGIAGGVLITIGLLLLIAAGPVIEALSLARLGVIALAATGYLIVGVVDDIVRLRAATKFVFQLVVAIGVVAGGVRATLVGVVAIDVVLSVLWIVVVVNAFNLTDVCDGLVGGLAAITFAFVAGLVAGTAFPALAVAGACAGFLVFNRPRASIFLGDAGSQMLGFLAAAGTIELVMAGAGEGRAVTIAQAMLLVGVPLFELAFLIFVRIRKGLPVWRGSPDHFSLRLQAAGLTTLQTDLVAWIAAASLGGIAFALPHLGAAPRVGVLAIAVVATAGAARFLLRHEVRPPKP